MTLHALGGGPALGALPALASPTTLAAGAVTSVMVWLGVLFIVVLVGGVALLFIRRWVLESGARGADVGWDLRSLRAMRDRGELSEEEYDVARARMIDALARTGGSPATPSAAGTPPHSGGELRAKPGFDLTGEPLPDFSGGENAASDEGERPKK